jgi:hypothetical protein
MPRKGDVVFVVGENRKNINDVKERHVAGYNQI